tara:strand:+ start:147 stop:611 length:465 start_codon:yes stop_codon:yes gene_type:complete
MIKYNVMFLNNSDKEKYKECYNNRTNYEDDAGLDLFMMKRVEVPKKSISFKIKLGIKINAYKGDKLTSYNIYPRSSMGSKTPLRLSNSIGLVDKGYTGELMIVVDNLSEENYVIEEGSRLVQLVGPHHESSVVNIVDVIVETDRSENGFGSTGN